MAEVKKATYYAFGTRGDFMFYATDSKVYTWRYGKETATDFLSVGSGEKIVNMKLYINPKDNSMNGKLLFVATQKGNEGKVYKILFNEMSGMPITIPQEYSGLGIIKDMYYKS